MTKTKLNNSTENVKEEREKWNSNAARPSFGRNSFLSKEYFSKQKVVMKIEDGTEEKLNVQRTRQMNGAFWVAGIQRVMKMKIIENMNLGGKSLQDTWKGLDDSVWTLVQRVPSRRMYCLHLLTMISASIRRLLWNCHEICKNKWVIWFWPLLLPWYWCIYW